VADFSFPSTALCRLFLLNLTSLAWMQKPLSSDFQLFYINLKNGKQPI